MWVAIRTSVFLLKELQAHSAGIRTSTSQSLHNQCYWCSFPTWPCVACPSFTLMKLDIHVDSEVWCWRPNCPDSRRRRKRTRRGSAKVAKKKKKTQSIIWLKVKAHAADHPLYFKHYQSKLATEPSSFQTTLMHLMTRCFRTSRNACTHKKLTCGLKPTWKHCENATLHIRSIGIMNIKGLNI